MSTLYELTGAYLLLLEMMDDVDNYDSQAVIDTLEGIDGELEIKAENYAKIIKEISAEAAKYAEEKERLAARQAALENRAKILKDNLYNAMKVTGKVKFKTGLFSFGIQKNGGLQPLEVKEGAKIPDEYLKKEPDIMKIRVALKEGKELPFAELKERGDHLVIR